MVVTIKENSVSDQIIPPATDIRTHCWFDHLLPRFAQDWARIARWDRPIGFWLLYWPCLWGLLLAPGFATLPVPYQCYWVMIFLAGAFVMRGAGCTINDLWDRKLDARVARTANRPLAAGRTSIVSAFIFLFLQLAVGLLVLLQLPLRAQIAALAYIPLIIAYPLMKRITMWPQAFLAVVFSAGALVGWLTIADTVNWKILILYLTTMVWVLGYDTVYAHMDQKDDVLVGIKSTVIALGERAVDLVVVCWWGVFMGWAFIGVLSDFPLIAWGTCFLAGLFQIFWCVWWNPDNDAKTLTYFKFQHWFGGMLTLACWYTVLQHTPT